MILNDAIDGHVLAWLPAFLADQLLCAKLGVAAGTAGYLALEYAADAAATVDVRRPPSVVVNVPAPTAAATATAATATATAAAGVAGELHWLRRRGRETLEYLAAARESMPQRRRGGVMQGAFHATFLVADAGRLALAAVVVLRAAQGLQKTWAAASVASGGDDAS